MKRRASKIGLPWALTALLVVLGVVLYAPGLLAQVAGQDLDGRTLTAVEVEGAKTLSTETLLYYLGLEVGRELDLGALNGNIKSLWARELVDDVSVDAFADGEGVRLVVKIVERPILRSIEYEGLKKVNRSDVQDQILRDGIRVSERSPLHKGELKRLSAAIEDLYRERGYRFTEVRYTLEEVAPNELVARFTVDEGDRVRIADIDFEGNSVFSDRRLRLAMRRTKESGFITRLMKRDIYNPAKLEEDLDRVRKLYREKGYKNIFIGEPEIDVKAKRPNAATIKQQKRRMLLQIPVEEGQRWRLGDISVDGNKQFTEAQLLRAFRHKSGVWLRSKKVDEGIEAIDELYKNTGYMFSRVTPELRERQETNIADLIVHVDENDQFQVGRVEFKGNDKTRDKVLRRELRVQEAFLMNLGALRDSVFRINQLGYFDLDEEDPVDFDVDSENKKVNLFFKGKESDRTELQFGGGWSESFGFEGQFAMRTRNFLGRGESVGISLQTGEFRSLFDLSYFIPWFLDRPQTVGARLFSQDLDFDLFGTQQFERTSRGVVLTYGRNLRPFQQLTFSYTLSRFKDRTTALIDGETQVRRFDLDNSSIRPVWTLDRRDHPFEPTRGKRLSLSLELAGGFLGGNNEFVRPEVEYSLFKPVSQGAVRTVFAINAEAGWIENLQDDVPLSPLELYYLGGENSIRGHRFRSIFVRDRNDDPVCTDLLGNRVDCTVGGTALGGDSFLQVNLEYHFLVGGPFRVLFFVDGGNVFASDQAPDYFDLRWTGGVEMRVLVPIFGAPLRFIYNVNLDEKPEDDFETFQFTVGTSF